MATARSSSDGVAIRYVLPVSRTTSCFHTMGPVDRIMEDAVFTRNWPGGGTIPVGRQTSTVFSWVRHNAAPRQSLLITIALFLLLYSVPFISLFSLLICLNISQYLGTPPPLFGVGDGPPTSGVYQIRNFAFKMSNAEMQSTDCNVI